MSTSPDRAGAPAEETDEPSAIVQPTELYAPAKGAEPVGAAPTRKQTAQIPTDDVYPAQNVTRPSTANPVVAATAPTGTGAAPQPVVTSSAVVASMDNEAEGDAEDAPAASAGAPSHAPFDALLKRYVDADGGVDYAGMKSQHGKLKSYLQTLAADAPGDDWSRDAALAYWINAYNAATLDLILDNYPLNSIKDLDGGNPWDAERVRLGDETYSLNGIENDVIRPRFKEPRIHFAVNCAAEGCPPLRNEAYTAERLDAQLAEQTREFLNDAAHTRLSGNTLEVTSIFDWYGEDFGNVAAYVRQYRDDVPAGATVEYSDYDWSLNAQ